MQTITIDYKTLKDNFSPMFEDVNQMGTEVYYQELKEGWTILFYKNHFYIKCYISNDELLVEAQDQVYKPEIINDLEQGIFGRNEEENAPYTLNEKDREELLQAKINSFKMTFLKKAIKVSTLPWWV